MNGPCFIQENFMPMAKEHKNITFAVILLALVAFIFIETATFTAEGVETEGLDPGFLPRTLGVFLGILSVLVLVRELYGLKRKKSNAASDTAADTVLNLSTVWYLFFIIVVYSVAMYFVGYLIATPFLFFATMSLMVETLNLRKMLFFILPISVGITVFLYIVFAVLISIPLPAGEISFFADLFR
jgi:hypothetical protein